MSALKSRFKSVSLVGRVSLTWLVMVMLSLAATSDAIAQGKSKKEKVPPGSPFQALQRQIDELQGQLEEGEFEALRVFNLDPDQPSTLFFGPTDFCNIGIDPLGGLTGLIERDPNGFRLLGRNDQGCRLLFGPTDDCTVEVNPQGPSGLLLRDPNGIRIVNPDIPTGATVFWGPTDDCSIGLVPDLTGLVESDPTGFRLLGQDNQGCRLIFGPTMDCTVEVDPEGPNGLLLRDARGIRILNPDPTLPPQLLFGPDDLCRIELSPTEGMIILEQNGVLVQNPDPAIPSRLSFGQQGGVCAISAGTDLGMIFVDPRGFDFDNDMDVQGNVTAQEFVQASSRRLKENIRPIGDALQKIEKLNGVYFDWDEQRGGDADVGFIAEDVAEVLPELVSRDEGGAPAGVSYGNIVAIAVEGVKAQQDQIGELKSQNAELRGELESMRTQFAKLAEQVDQMTKHRDN